MHCLRPFRPFRWAPLAAALLAALLAGCGPGSGGTGTGAPSNGFVLAGATATSLCGSGFASQLTCGTTAGALPGDIGPGTSVTRYADIASGGNVAVTFQANSVQLQARCQRITFNGDWGIVGTNDARFFGGYVIDGVGVEVLASVSVIALPGRDDALQIVLREADGRVVLGPLVVQKVALPVLQPAACP